MAPAKIARNYFPRLTERDTSDFLHPFWRYGHGSCAFWARPPPQPAPVTGLAAFLAGVRRGFAGFAVSGPFRPGVPPVSLRFFSGREEPWPVWAFLPPALLRISPPRAVRRQRRQAGQRPHRAPAFLCGCCDAAWPAFRVTPLRPFQRRRDNSGRHLRGGRGVVSATVRAALLRRDFFVAGAAVGSTMVCCFGGRHRGGLHGLSRSHGLRCSTVLAPCLPCGDGACASWTWPESPTQYLRPDRGDSSTAGTVSCSSLAGCSPIAELQRTVRLSWPPHRHVFSSCGGACASCRLRQRPPQPPLLRCRGFGPRLFTFRLFPL